MAVRLLRVLGCVCLLAGLSTVHAAKEAAPRTLQHSDAKKWQRLEDIVTAEIKVSANKLLQERGQRLVIPLEVDVLMLGLDGGGAYHISLDHTEMEEILASQHIDRDICPTIWQTGQQASTCVVASYVSVLPADATRNLQQIEDAIRQHMVKAEVPKAPSIGKGELELPVYNVDAAKLEHVFLSVLNEAYRAEGLPGTDGVSGRGGDARVAERLAIIVINPSKHRMSPLMEKPAGQAAWQSFDINREWQRGINSSRLHLYEAGYTYRYSYGGKGASEAWVSQHNFVVLDISAGPTSFGPTVSVSGRTSPTAIPRILPTLEAMATEVESATQITQQNALRQDAIHSHQRMLEGQLASAIGAATEFLMIPDMALQRIELAKTVLVNLVLMHDHDEFNLMDGGAERNGVEREVDLNALHAAMTQILPNDMVGVVMPTPAYLHYHPEVMAALSRARISWSEAVMKEAPYIGLHHAQHVRLDSETLIKELMAFVPMFLAEYTEEMDNEGVPVGGNLAASVRHNGTRQLHVVVLSLKSAPPGLLFENGQLVAASHDMVVVLQLLHPPTNRTAVPGADKAGSPQQQAGSGGEAAGKEAGSQAASQAGDAHHTEDHEEFEEVDADVDAAEWAHVYSGHVQDGFPLELDAAGGVTARIVAGLSTALGGLTFPWEKVNPDLGGVRVQDWRWAVGCLPWGPYAACTSVSAVLQAAIRRNHLISHIETGLQAVQYRLDAVDNMVEAVFEGPWMHVVPEAGSGAANGTSTTRARRQWLDVLASHSAELAGTANAAMNKRVEGLLSQMEKHLEKLSWSLYLHSAWDTASEHVLGLLHAADQLTSDLDEDIRTCQEVAACCFVRHGMPLLMDVTLLVILAVLLLAFGGIALAVMSNKKIYRPIPVGSPGRAPSGGLSRSGNLNKSGLLPLFGGQTDKSLLPR